MCIMSDIRLTDLSDSSFLNAESLCSYHPFLRCPLCSICTVGCLIGISFTSWKIILRFRCQFNYWKGCTVRKSSSFYPEWSVLHVPDSILFLCDPIMNLKNRIHFKIVFHYPRVLRIPPKVNSASIPNFCCCSCTCFKTQCSSENSVAYKRAIGSSDISPSRSEEPT